MQNCRDLMTAMCLSSRAAPDFVISNPAGAEFGQIWIFKSGRRPGPWPDFKKTDNNINTCHSGDPTSVITPELNLFYVFYCILIICCIYVAYFILILCSVALVMPSVTAC